jgi:RimJ/RimL family protein N-acetyltransferase
MDVEFVPWRPEETEELVGLLLAEEWPFHAGTADRAELLARVAAGFYAGPDARTVWIVAGGVRAGFLRLFDLDDDTPMFDLRLRAAYRGQGLGTAAVRWLTGDLFAARPATNRVEATTRSDNAAMRRVLERCGYRQEARYREAWPVPGGPPLDALGYAVLRREWAASVRVTGVDEPRTAG